MIEENILTLTLTVIRYWKKLLARVEKILR